MRWKGKIQPADFRRNGMTVTGARQSAGKAEKGKKKNAGDFWMMKMMTGVNGGSTERQIGRKIVRIKVLFILEPRNALRIQRQLLLS